ncbi:MAG: hypothetical protein ACE5MK_04865 [Acidobacteriota bacterium]
MKDQIVAVLHLGKEQAMLAAPLLALLLRKEGGEVSEPLLPAGNELLGRQGVGQLLESFRVAAMEEGIGAPTETDYLLAASD